MLKISFSEQQKQLETVLSFLSIFRLLNLWHKIFVTNHVLSIFFLAFLRGPHNSESFKYWANDEPGFMTGQFYSIYQDIAKNMKGEFAQNLKNGPDIYEHALINSWFMSN